DLPPRFAAEVARLQVRMLQRGRDYAWAQQADGSWELTGRRGNTGGQLNLPPVSLPRDNLATAVQAFWAGGMDMPDAEIARAIAETSVAGRLDARCITWRGQPRQLLLDVGHNPQAAEYLAGYLAQDPAPDQVAVFGLLSDKDLAGILQPLRGCFASWAVAPLPTPRSRPAAELAAELERAGERAMTFADIGEAIAWQLDHTPVDTKIIIFGSFF